jgi:hypothetical protein
LKAWFHRNIVAPLLAFLRQGTSPARLALCVALGVVIGNIPILGVSSIICALIALMFRLNLPAIQLVQAAMAPSQVLLIIPFVRLGEKLLGVPPQPISIPAALELMRQGVLPAVRGLWDAILHAGFAWLLMAPILIFALTRLLTRVFERASRMQAAGASS